MSDQLAIFWKRLQASGLLDPGRFEAVQAEVEAARLDDVKAVAKWMIAKEFLTRFQAKVLLAAPKLPLVFGDYVVIDELPEAPFAETYRVKHVPTGHELMAIFHRASSYPMLDQALSVQRIYDRLLADRPIRQAQCVKGYEVFRKADRVIVIADLVKGKSLRTAMTDGQWQRARASEAIVQLALALAAWHEAGVAHADLTPDTVLVCDDGSIKLWHDPLYLPSSLLDADVATLRELEARAPYLAPELDVQQAPYSHLTDLYALGAVYFEMLTGRAALKRDSLVATMQAHATERIPDLSAWRVAKPIEQIVTYLMAKRSDVRYQDATAVANQVTQFSESPIEIPPPPMPLPTATSFERWIERRSPLHLTDSAAAAPAATPQASPFGAAPFGAAPQGAGLPGMGVSPLGLGGMVGGEAPVSHNSPLRMIEARKQAQKRQRLIMAITAGVLGIGGLIGAGIYYSRKGNEVVTPENGASDPTQTNSTNPSGSGDNTPSGTTVDSNAAVPQAVVEDDGELLWESPTQGEPLSLAGTPDNPRGFIVLSPAELLAGNPGLALIDALGPDFATWRSQWETALGVNLDQAKRVVVSLHDTPAVGSAYSTLIRVELEAPIDAATLKRRWESSGFAEGSGNLWEKESETLAVAASDASGKVSAFVHGPAELVEQAIAKANDSPILSPDQRLLLPSVDGDRNIIVIFTVTNLFSPEGQAWLGSFWRPFAAAVEPILFDGVQTFAFAAHRDTDWYLELTATKRVGQTAEQLVGKWNSSAGGWANRLEAGIAEVPQHPYWERVRLRYPGWFRELLGSLRFGVESNFARANTWLPDPAGPNLVAGTELILAALSEPAVASNAPQTPAATVPASLDELLQVPIDFAVSSDDMINVMAQLQDSISTKFPTLPFKFTIRLVGRDLGTEGITQNQRINNFNATGRPLQEVLTQLVVLANPDKASSSPRDEKQKLLWIVGPLPDDASQTAILITTRKAATRDMIELPEPFRSE